ncbi:hypothetical protein BANRA_05721 [Klebsiella pneumoniae]|nr:hypothetical protein BANRA_05721 [Klebsiella pneumoniae]
MKKFNSGLKKANMMIYLIVLKHFIQMNRV